MRLAVIVIAHSNPGQLALLLRAVSHPQTRLYLHVDRSKPLDPFRTALAGIELTLLPRYVSRWGTAGVVDAVLAGLRAAHRDGCDYFVLATGQDLPLWPIGDLLDFFGSTPARSYLSYRPIDQDPHQYRGRDRTSFYAYTVLGRREICIPRGEDTSYFNWKGRALNTALRAWSVPRGPRRFPSYAEPFSGHMEWNLSRHAADYVLDFVDTHPDWRRFHEHTYCAAELFFASILAGTAYQGELENDSLRFFRWGDRHALVLTLDDLPAIMSSGKPFARKFDEHVDRRVIDHLVDRLQVDRRPAM